MILLAFGPAGLDVRILYDWDETRGLPDPWAVTVGSRAVVSTHLA